jgi:hypothetical protein
MTNYVYEFAVKDRGYVDVPSDQWTDMHYQKYKFTELHLSPTLKASKCGWSNAQYKLMKLPLGGRTEFLVLWEGEVGKSGSRWINVTGDSYGSIMCAMCDNLW